MNWLEHICPPDWAAAMAHAMKTYNITTPDREAMFVAQCAHETQGFIRFVENLNYSAKGLIQTFRVFRKSPYHADKYAHNPVMIANFAYANRMGNGGEESGDGWRFRGRGCIQLTGRGNYVSAANALRYPLVTLPDSVLEPTIGAAVSAWYWHTHHLNSLADLGKFAEITSAINPAMAGQEDREKWLSKVRALQSADTGPASSAT